MSSSLFGISVAKIFAACCISVSAMVMALSKSSSRQIMEVVAFSEMEVVGLSESVSSNLAILKTMAMRKVLSPSR